MSPSIVLKHEASMHLLDCLDRISREVTASSPLTIRPILKGHSNQNYHLQWRDHCSFLRLDNDVAKLFQLNRSQELQLLEKLATKGIAPAVEFSDLEKGILLTEFIQGRELQPEDVDDEAICSGLKTFFSTLSQYSLPVQQFELPQNIDSFFSKLLPEAIYFQQLQPYHQQAIQCIQRLSEQHHCLQLCHNDLNLENILVSDEGKIVAIDWEYCGCSHIQLELAKLANALDLNNQQIQQLHSLDPERLPNPWDEIRHLARYIDAVWYGLMAQNKNDPYWHQRYLRFSAFL